MTMGVIWGKKAEKQNPHIEHSLGGNLFCRHPFKICKLIKCTCNTAYTLNSRLKK